MTRKKLVLIALAPAVAIQFIPVERRNPPVESEIAAPPEVQSILRQSCYDCHSHETNWPWYSSVAPVSWLVAHDVEEGREHLNFSTWYSHDAAELDERLEEIWKEVEEGEMPRWFYPPLHPGARLVEEELETLRLWVDASRTALTGTEPSDAVGEAGAGAEKES